MDFDLTEFKAEIGELIERSAYARMLVAQALAECLDDKNLRGFYNAAVEYECKQNVRWLYRDGVPCDVVEPAPVRDMGLVTDACMQDGIIIRFVRRV